MSVTETMPINTTRIRRFVGYTFVDFATQAYLLLVGLLILFFHGNTVAGWPFLVVAHAATLGVVHALIWAQARKPQNRPLDFFRHFYPVLLYTAFYREAAHLNQIFVSGYLDPVFIRLDYTLFGFHPSLAFMNALPFLAVSELFYAAYFSYYLMIVGVGLALFLRDRRQFFHYVSVVSFIFYVCYLFYIAVPVVGPPIFSQTPPALGRPDSFGLAEAPTVPAAIQLGPFYRLMAFIYDTFEAPGAAFPSSHVAVAITTLWFSFRYLPRIRWAHLIAVALLCLATVYCRYHYVVDVLAGVVTAALLLPVGNWLYRRNKVT